jgi:integrase
MARADDARRSWGKLRKLPSGKWQASYVGPDDVRHSASTTFDDKETAQLWLKAERRLVEETPETWRPPKERVKSAQAAAKRRGLTFGEYAETWLATRKNKKGQPLSPRTREHYRKLLDEHILPTFGPLPLRDIEPEDVDAWHVHTLPHAPTMRAHAYGLLRTICGTATDRRLMSSNPARIVGAGNADRARDVRPATLEELATIVSAMPERHRLMVLLAAWCSLRFGELAALRRTDVDTKNGIIHVRHGVIRAEGKTIVKEPKTAAGRREVAIPPHVVQLVREHRLEHADASPNGLMFPGAKGGHLAPSAFYGRAAELTKDGSVKRAGWGWYAARQAAGRDDLRFHDLRHTGAVLAAQTGATLAELMHRLGHTTAGAAMRYQHSAKERDTEIARRLSELVGGEQ